MICTVGIAVVHKIQKLSPLPRDQKFLHQVELSVDIIKALIYENRREYKKSLDIWNSLDHEIQKVQDHVFYLTLIDLASDEYPAIPDSESSNYLMARYYSWVKNWKKAYDLLSTYRNIGSYSLRMELEFIRLGLYLGKYHQIESLLFLKEQGNRREQFQLDILRMWYFVLMEETNEVKKLINKLDDEYLYITSSVIRPFGSHCKELNSLEALNSELIRYPADLDLFEELVLHLTSLSKFDELAQLHDTHRLVSTRKLHWELLAVIYLGTDQYERLNSLLRSSPALGNSLEFLDFRARLAIKNKHWETLYDIAHQFIDKYPELYDGHLYLAEFYRQTGNREELQSILLQIFNSSEY